MSPEWRRRLIIAGAVAGALGLGYVLGRLSGPERVEYVDRKVVEYKSLSVEDITASYFKTRTVERVVYRNVVTTITVTPDAGTVTTIADNSIEREGSTETHSGENKTARREEIAGRQESEQSKVITSRPVWNVSAFAGASMGQPLIPIAGPLTLGLGLEARVADSPVWVGGWLMTHGAAGASVRVELPAKK